MIMTKQMLPIHTSIDKVYEQIAPLIRNARTSIIRTIDRTMVHTYWNIGRYIVEEEQAGEERAQPSHACCPS